MTVSKDNSGNIKVAFPYNPRLVEKVKFIPVYIWHPTEKYWSFPDSNGILEKILKTFEGEEIHIAPPLEAKFPIPHASRITLHEFYDLRRELLSRKYSYKTVKGYLYFNRDFFNFIDKNPSDAYSG